MSDVQNKEYVDQLAKVVFLMAGINLTLSEDTALRIAKEVGETVIVDSALEYMQKVLHGELTEEKIIEIVKREFEVLHKLKNGGSVNG